MRFVFKLLRWFLLLVVGLIAVLAAAFVVSYLAADAPPPLASTVAQDPSLPSLTLDGYTFHLETFGEQGRPVVIVLHGGPGDDYRMLLPLQALSDNYLVVMYDQRGAGLSPRVDAEQLTYEQTLLDLDVIVNYFSPDEPVRLLGHSWGAMVASGYLGRRPDRVLQAVLAEPGFLTPEAGQDFLEMTGHGMPPLSFGLLSALWWSAIESLKVDGPDDQAGQDYFMLRLITSEVPGHPLAGYFCGRTVKTARLEHFRFGALANDSIRQGSIGLEGQLRAPFAEGVDRFERKVLFVAGECNTLIGEAHQRKHHLKLFRETELKVIAGAGHTMFGEQPEASIAVIREYFEELAPRQDPPDKPRVGPDIDSAFGTRPAPDRLRAPKENTTDRCMKWPREVFIAAWTAQPTLDYHPQVLS